MNNLLRIFLTLLLLFAALKALAQHLAAHPDVVQAAQQTSDGEILHLVHGTLRIKPCDNKVIRITYLEASSIPDLSNPALPDAVCPNGSFTIQDSSQSIEIDTNKVHVVVSKNSGAIQFRNAENNPILAETDWPYPRHILAASNNSEYQPQASAWFALDPDERLYGLGQHQNGILNQRNLEMELSQDNTNISVPFFLSSKGYGLLWNNSSVSSWNNRFRPVLEIESKDASVVDYYYLAGPSFDEIIAGYRHLSGTAPLFSRWAYGYWQSKLGYTSSEQLLSVAAKYRELHIPMDNIVLDAGWETTLGSRIFNQHYPDPGALVHTLHAEHVHLMVSVWPLFMPGSDNFKALDAKGYFITPGRNRLPDYLPGARLYDPFNAEAREAYWEQASKSLYDIGVDSFWLDSTEPADLYAEEHGPMLDGAKTALGDGSKYANIFPLMTTEAMYEGHRSQPNNKRVFILTRSAFTGMQRYAAAAWSGDSLTTFDTFRRQIPAGLNYSMSGLPYWTTDIGGFVGGDTSDPAYRELFVRWFEYGTFCPLFRAHGARRNNQNELWSFGPEAQKILTQYDRLRYRLLPYIYTLAGRTTFENYTPMRALAFDFAKDQKALDISDEFMLGPALLVAPVIEAGATSREVYLPAGADWYDFWTGKKWTGGQTIHRAAALAVLPLFVRAGSILPLGPEQEYTDQHPDAPIELRIYPGADGETSLYNDNGLNYDYEKGQYSWLPMHWKNATHTLLLDERNGQYAEALSTQKFIVTRVTRGQATGEGVTVGGHAFLYDNRAQHILIAP